jgi:DNA-binding transcriptional regulator YiaG
MYHRFEYVSVEAKRRKAEKQVEKLRKQGKSPKPVPAFTGKMAATFWGKSWCDNLESYADYDNRLGRGRSYARCGCVCHLEIENGRVRALVSGTSLYTLTIRIQPLAEARWRAVCAKCAGQVGSLLELLQGKISRQVMEIMCDRSTGIFPSPSEIAFDCSCPDAASMCKHVAAALYGAGRRLDTEPELLFLLRGVNAEDLIPAGLDFTRNAPPDSLQGSDLGALFGIDLEEGAPSAPTPDPALDPAPSRRPAASAKKTAPRERAAKAAPGAGRKAPFKPGRPTGEGIRRLRKLADLTPAAFAQALGVSAATLSRWEDSKGVLVLRSASVKSLQAFQEKLLSGK